MKNVENFVQICYDEVDEKCICIFLAVFYHRL